MAAPLPRAVDYAGTMLDALQSSLGLKVDRREGSRWDALVGTATGNALPRDSHPTARSCGKSQQYGERSSYHVIFLILVAIIPCQNAFTRAEARNRTQNRLSVQLNKIHINPCFM